MVPLILLSLLGSAVAVEQYKLPAWECEGGKTYLESDIIYYYNASDVLCYADRKGCTPLAITETFKTLDECIKQRMPDGRTKTKTFMCENQFWGNSVYTVPFGNDKAAAFPILRACHATERFCPEGYACFEMSNGVHSCCATSSDVKGPDYVKTKYNKNLAV